MHFNAHLDIDLVAVEQEDEVSVLLELTAPQPKTDVVRAPATLQIVLDRSGSMSGGRLDAALTALDALVARLDPTDRFGLVMFDDQVDVVVPAGPLHDKASVRELLRRIVPGGCTNLSGGYLRGLQEAQRASNGSGATLLLLSDGHANAGITDAGELESVAAAAHRRGITTTTLGLGLGYDEVLMTGVARGGTGSHHFAEEGDTAGRLVSGEVDGLLAQAVQAASLIIRPTAAVPGLRIWNDVSSTAIEGGVMVELGDLYAGEKRKVIVSTVVPAMAELGLAKVADLQLRYVELPGLHEHTIETPIYVNVVPGDQAAGRIADPVVRTEMHYQQAQDAKRRAADALRCADPAEAERLYAEAGERLDVAACAAPPALAAEMAEETALLRDLAQRAVRDDASRVAKFSDADRAFKARKRGR